MANQQKQCAAYSKMFSRCGKINYYKVICRSRKHRQSQKSTQSNKEVLRYNKINLYVEVETSFRTFYSVKIRYLHFNSVRSVIFTKIRV